MLFDMTVTVEGWLLCVNLIYYSKLCPTGGDDGDDDDVTLLYMHIA